MEQENDSTAAERLRSARSKAGFASAAAAARHFKWGEAAYRHHENGTRAFGAEQAMQYAAAYRVSASWLLALVGRRDNNRVPVARFYTEVYAQRLGEGSELYELINQMYSKLGLVMFPELNVYVDDFEWIVGGDGLPPMHFINPSELSVMTENIADGFIFAYRVGRRFPHSRLEIGNLLLIDSSVDQVGRQPHLYLFRDQDSPFLQIAQRTTAGDTLLIPDTEGGIVESANDLAHLQVVGKVVWISQTL
ncbi:hypothetical protein [Sphingomonas endolithica]|uniref:hypothetical protein n=1 Tax=Sphingomonas endolithica TaxID=2972485 RepID=UPI0021AEB1C1|nr:hypothetical protein [Sphingomonas sp. ZFBP2030]